MDDWVWIVIGIVVALLVIGAVLAVARKRAEENKREEAAELRENADRWGSKIDQREADARSVEAEAQRVRAEADKLEAVAEQRRMRAESERAEHAETLRRADEIDPDTEEPSSESAIVDRPTPDRGLN
jgi:flagellar biosynthesis/type III secretory pathway M-ring protein FliF/YscJ